MGETDCTRITNTLRRVLSRTASVIGPEKSLMMAFTSARFVKRHQRIGMAMAQLVLALEQGDLLHVLFIFHAVQNSQPMRDGLTVSLFDGREIRRGALGFVYGWQGGLLLKGLGLCSTSDQAPCFSSSNVKAL